MNNKKFIFVTGFFGAPVRETAEKLAADNNADLISLDDEIEAADGRSVLRICMIMGEHEYRNKEYEALLKLTADSQNSPQDFSQDNNTSIDDMRSTPSANEHSDTAVIICSDGVLLDEMSADIIKKHDLVIAGRDMSCDELWQNACKIKASCHAFMTMPDEQARRKAFDELYSRQKLLFS